MNQRLMAAVMCAAFTATAVAQTPAARGAMFVKITDTRDSTLWGAEVELTTLGVKFQVPDIGVLLIKDVPAGTYVLQARRVGYAQQVKLVRVAAAASRSPSATPTSSATCVRLGVARPFASTSTALS
jgi:hypothetical protein